MLFKKFQQLAQWVGFFAIAALALYGLVTMGSGRLWAAGEESRRAETDAPQITIPSTFNYQGFLRNPDGTPMGGTHTIQITLWNLLDGGATLYSENFTNVSVRDGLFNVVLGSTKTMDTAYFLGVAPMYVSISVDGGAELIPRQRIHPVPWAILATSAQTANTLSPNASVQNLTNIGTLKIDDSSHYIEKNGNELRFWAPKGFGWVGKDQNSYLMTLNDTAGASINGGLNVNGAMTMSGTRPVLIKRYLGKAINNAITDTGISATTYECTVAGWSQYMDVAEIGAGEWRRQMYRNNTGTWDLHYYTNVHGSTNPAVWVDVLCFQKDIVTIQYDSGVAAASDSQSNMPLPASETTGQ